MTRNGRVAVGGGTNTFDAEPEFGLYARVVVGDKAPKPPQHPTGHHSIGNGVTIGPEADFSGPKEPPN
jgi:hypothetical protein